MHVSLLLIRGRISVNGQFTIHINIMMMKLRHASEHRSPARVDHAACQAGNMNDTRRRLAGSTYGPLAQSTCFDIYSGSTLNDRFE